MSQLSELLSREEIMEKQRSRFDWLRDGDRNTPLFQAKSKERARSNRITTLRAEDGTILSEQADLERRAAEFYKNLFEAQGELDPGQILEYVPRKVTDEMNANLVREYTAEEVEKAVFMMGPNKSPGPDGFTAGFYQHHWQLVGPSVTRVVLHFLNEGAMDEGINQTTLVLIPKTKNPQDMKHFRPISLCNVIYKVCSKVLANRLRFFLMISFQKNRAPLSPAD